MILFYKCLKCFNPFVSIGDEWIGLLLLGIAFEARCEIFERMDLLWINFNQLIMPRGIDGVYPTDIVLILHYPLPKINILFAGDAR